MILATLLYGTGSTRDADYTIDIATDADAITMTRAQNKLLGTDGGRNDYAVRCWRGDR